MIDDRSSSPLSIKSNIFELQCFGVHSYENSNFGVHSTKKIMKIIKTATKPFGPMLLVLSCYLNYQEDVTG